mmetsp:Transcript_6605/g.25514  ORF Transcript_6605/g.25514 Transcript_6605/m.25514 type:complete len:221 (-) Transcript_6605:1565-2227(-)
MRAEPQSDAPLFDTAHARDHFDHVDGNFEAEAIYHVAIDADQRVSHVDHSRALRWERLVGHRVPLEVTDARAGLCLSLAIGVGHAQAVGRRVVVHLQVKPKTVVRIWHQRDLVFPSRSVDLEVVALAFDLLSELLLNQLAVACPASPHPCRRALETLPRREDSSEHVERPDSPALEEHDHTRRAQLAQPVHGADGVTCQPAHKAVLILVDDNGGKEVREL